MDRCRVWESHSEQTGSDQGVDLDQDNPEWSGVSGRAGGLRGKLKEQMVSAVGEPKVPVPVASVILNDGGTQRKVEKDNRQLASLEVISSLVTQLLPTAREGRLANGKLPPEEGTGSSSVVPEVGDTVRGHSTSEGARVCFSCGRPAHGVNRCSQVDTSFPFLLTGWGLVGGCPRWPISGGTDWWNWDVV